MSKEEIVALITNTYDIGINVVNEFDEEKFKEFLASLATIIWKAEVDGCYENQDIVIVIRNLKKEKIEDYRLSLIEKFFYFKKYKYMFNENLITNKNEHIKKRFILEINEKLNNLKNHLDSP